MKTKVDGGVNNTVEGLKAWIVYFDDETNQFYYFNDLIENN